MYSSRETRVLNWICVLLVFLTGAVRATRDMYPLTDSNTLIFFLFITAGLIWLIQIRRRIIQPEERKYLMWMAAFLLFLITVRTVKYVFTTEGSVFNRYLWYLYYFPQTFLVLFMFLAVLHIGREYDRPVHPGWKILYIPAVLITLGIMTNDIHQLAFRFPDGMAEWNDSYIHGPFYFISLLWLLILFVAMLVISMRRCTLPENHRNIWMPLVPLGIGLVYIVAFFVNPYGILQQLYKTTEVICFVFPAFIEGLIQAGLFPSNDCYETLWNLSDVSGKIVDHAGNIWLGSDKEITDQVLSRHEISGGAVYWVQDMEEIHSMNRKLRELGDTIEEENTILQKENSLAERREQISQQNMIYDSIFQVIRPQLVQLEEILEQLPEEEKEFESRMKYGAVLIAYIKRASNLILLMHQNSEITVDELKLSIEESLNYVRMCGTKAVMLLDEDVQKELVSGEKILLLYRFFEKVLENCIQHAETVFVTVECRQNIRFYIEITTESASAAAHFRSEFCENDFYKNNSCTGFWDTAVPAELKSEYDAKTVFLTLTLPETEQGGAV